MIIIPTPSFTHTKDLIEGFCTYKRPTQSYVFMPTAASYMYTSRKSSTGVIDMVSIWALLPLQARAMLPLLF